MSAITQLICNNFGGIRERSASFSEELITAQDMQNVELYDTGANGGVGIRTVYGNVSLNNTLVDSATIIKLFESVQKQQKYFFIYAETEEKGIFYSLDRETNTLETIKDNITKSNKEEATGFDVVQGWSDLFFFTNGKEMFTVEMDAQKILYAFVYNNLTIYADSNNAPTKLYISDGNTYSYYTGTEWTISDTSVKYNDNAATYTSASNITLSNAVFDMDLYDRDNRSVKGIIAGLYDNRLWIANGNILWYSVKANIYDFITADGEITTSAGYIELLKNITAIHEYIGTLAVFFADSSVQVSVSEGEFKVGNESPGGCAGYNALVFHDTNLYFYDDTKKSVFSFKQVITGEKTLGENVAVEIQSILLDIDSTTTNKIQAVSIFIQGRNEIWWLIPTESTYEVKSVVEDTEVTVEKQASIVLIFDYLKGEWIKRKSQKINSVSVIDNSLYSAGSDGNIFEEYKSNAFNGDYIQSYYNCSPMNLGSMNTLKVLVFPPRASFDMPYSNQFYVKYVKNYNIFKKPKIRYIKTKLKNFLYWGIGHWGVEYWASKNTSSIGKFPSATFKVLEISIYNTKRTENFSIKNLEFSKIKVKQV